MPHSGDRPSRRILLVSYWYPPGVGAAAERMGAFARYLPEHGWQPHVLTVERPGAHAAGGREGEGEDCRDAATVHAAREGFSSSGRPFADYDPRRRPSRIRGWLRDRVFPDRFVGWQRRAHPVGLGVIRRHKIDVILASFPPASAVLLGMRLHRQTGVPLVLDFRDRWFGPGGYEPRRMKARRRHEDLQRQAIRDAAGIVVVSEAMAEAMIEEHGVRADRVAVVTNGFERQASSTEGVIAQRDVAAGGASERFMLAHVGTVIARNRPDLFFESLVQSQPLSEPGDVVFRFVGNLSRDYVDAAGLAPLVETTGLVSRDEARAEMAAADGLLLLTGDYVGRWGHNAKVFEYLATGKPILCLEQTPGSNDRALLERVAADRVFFAPLGDAAALGQAVDAMRRAAPVARGSVAVDGGLEAYSRRNLVAGLAEQLSAWIEPPG